MAFSDRARDFWDRISPRERLLVVVGAIAAPITLAVWLGLSITDGLSAMEVRNDRVRAALAAIPELKNRAPAQQPDEVVAIPSEPLPLETYLNNAATAAGFSLKGTSPRPSVTKNGFVTNSVSFQLEDLEIEKLKAFLQGVEGGSAVVVVTRLDIKRDFRDKKKIDATIEVSTYSKERSDKDGKTDGGSPEKKGG